MPIPKRAKGFRDRAAEDKEQLQDDYQESYNTKDDRGFAVGSVFDLELLKELGVPIWRPDIGEHVIDVIPFYAGVQHPLKNEGQLTYKVDFWAHQRIGPMNDFFICNALTWKIADPICAWMKQNYIEDKKQYNAIKPSRRCAYLVWVHDNKEQIEKGIQILEVSHFFFEKKVAEIAKKPRGGGFVDWTHFDTGRHVYWTINKTGKYEDDSGTKRDSIEWTAFQLIPRETPKIPDHILEQSFALDEVIKMRPTEEEVKIAFFGSSEGPKEEAKTETSRLPKKTALERAREAAQKEAEGPSDETSPEQKEPQLVEGVVCEHCGAEVYDTDSGRVCADGHGGIEGTSLSKTTSSGVSGTEETPDEPPPVEESPETGSVTIITTKPVGDYVCPASEVGGQFGVTIEQLDECDDCKIWEACSDANEKMSKGDSAPPPPAEKEEPKTETKSKGKLVRR